MALPFTRRHLCLNTEGKLPFVECGWLLVVYWGWMVGLAGGGGGVGWEWCGWVWLGGGARVVGGLVGAAYEKFTAMKLTYYACE
jgi:hypothetical protein